MFPLLYKQDGHLLPAYFPPSNFVKDAFQNDEIVFFSNSFFMNFSNISKLKSFQIFSKKDSIQVE